MMTNEQYLLGKLAEEAAELAQIAIKAQQFGLDHVFGGQGDNTQSNAERISAEMNDTVAVFYMLVGECGADLWLDGSAQLKKMDKVAYWRDRSPAIDTTKI